MDNHDTIRANDQQGDVMAPRGKKTPEDQASTEPEEHPYAGYVPPAVADTVEVRINNKIVFLDHLFGAKLAVGKGGVQIKGSYDEPEAKADEAELYDPTVQELPSPNVITSTTESTVPVTYFKDTEKLAKQFDGDEKE